MDVDSEEARRHYDNQGLWRETFTVQTGRGWQFYFAYPADANIRNSAGKLGIGLDIRGEGGYVIAPPSRHYSGKRYSVLHAVPVAAPPNWLLKKLTEPASSPATNNRDATDPLISKGGRNETLHKLGSKLRGQGDGCEVIEAYLQAKNKTCCDPPLDETEVLKIARNVCGYEPNDPQDESLLIVRQPPLEKRITKMDQILRNMPEERLFFMPVARRFVHAIEYGTTSADKKVRRDPRAPVLADVSATYLRVVLSRSGKVFGYDKKGHPVPADPQRDDMEAFLDVVTKAQTRQRVLRMLSTTPVLQLDGTIVSEPGYHEPSEILIQASGIRFEDPDPDETLSADECRALLDRDFSVFFDECPFVREHPDQQWYETQSFSVVPAGALCIVLRNLVPCTPAHCVSAPAQRTGKTFLVQLVSVLTTGIEPTAISYDGSEEFGKSMLPIIEAGDRVLLVDNVDRVVNNNKLAIALTQRGSITWRVLTQSKTKTVENSGVFWFTGNQLQFTGEMPTRCVMSQLDSGMERPEDRKFNRARALDEAKQMHPRAVMTLLRVARAHMRADFPGFAKLQKPMGGFDEYSQWVRGVLVWMGYEDPKNTQAEIRANDPGLAANEELVVMVRDVIGDRECSVREIKERLKPADLLRFMELTQHKPNESLSELKVGQYFGRLRNRWFGGYRVVWGKYENHKRKWRVEIRQQEAINRVEEEPL